MLELADRQQIEHWKRWLAVGGTHLNHAGMALKPLLDIIDRLTSQTAAPNGLEALPAKLIGRRINMNKNQLLILKEGIEQIISERRAVGEYNADSKHMLFLLSNMLALIDHAISQAKPEKK